MKLKPILYITLSIALLLGIKFIFFPGNADKGGPNKIGPKKDEIYQLEVAVAKFQKLDSEIRISGNVLAYEEAELRPEIAGKLTYLQVNEGATVSKGTLIAKINDADLQAQLKKLQVQYKLAGEKFERAKKLFEIQGISKEEMDIAENAQKTLEAEIDFIKAQISKTEIYAPFSGSIGFKNISEGAYVNSSTIIANIAQTDVLKIDFSIPEKYASRIRKGMELEFESESDRKSYKASIALIEPRIDPVLRTLKVRAIYRNVNKKLFPGSFVKIKLNTESNENAILVPSEAVVPEINGSKVFLLKEGKAKSTKIVTGMRNETFVEAVSGIQVGDTLITNGLMSLKEGAVVVVKKVKS